MEKTKTVRMPRDLMVIEQIAWITKSRRTVERCRGLSELIVVVKWRSSCIHPGRFTSEPNWMTDHERRNYDWLLSYGVGLAFLEMQSNPLLYLPTRTLSDDASTTSLFNPLGSGCKEPRNDHSFL